MVDSLPDQGPNARSYPPVVPLEWSARHLRDVQRPIRSWSHVEALLGNVGTTEWPWLRVQSSVRSAQCFGFADVLAVTVATRSLHADRAWRVSSGALDVKWVDASPLGVHGPRVRQSQVLSLPQVVVAFYDWLTRGQVEHFTLEEI